MALPSQDRLQSLIEWNFSLVSDIGEARYGTYAGSFWKQYLPAGIPIPAKHPPKRIPEDQYRRAEKHGKKLSS